MRFRDRRRQQGFSLVELLVVTAIMVVVVGGLLLMFDRANKVFKTSNEAAEMQQNLRVAYDRLIADVRMAGFDYARTGRVGLTTQGASTWTAGRTYSAGAIVVPTTPNGHTYRATNQGTAGLTEPSWPTGAGSTVAETGGSNPVIIWHEYGGAVYDQPDEQIEFAGATAITIRANFDYSANQAGDGDHGRETDLESSPFPVVTTGNDEIVTYALVSTTSAANTGTVSFFADVNSSGARSRTAYPGGNPEREIHITGVDLTNANPPYTLYRFTLADDGSVNRMPLAENIRSLNFFYYENPQATAPLRDLAATPALAPNIGGGGQYNPAAPATFNATNRLIRRKIRAVRVRLAGMSVLPDVNYSDTSTANGMLGSITTAGVPVFVTDTIAPRYRRIALDTLVVPRNLGLMGMPQTLTQPPATPTITAVCSGYCGIAYVVWNPNSVGLTSNFTVLWDTDPDGDFFNAVPAGVTNAFAVDMTQLDISEEVYFKVRAYNEAGSRTSEVFGPVSVQNATQPGPPINFLISGGATSPIGSIPGKIRLQWSVNPANSSSSAAPSCSSGSPPQPNFVREVRAFRIHRGTTEDFTPDGTNLIVDENTPIDEAPAGDGYGNFFWVDTAAPCTDYYYRIQAVEWCVANNDYNADDDTATSVGTLSPTTTNAMHGRAGSSGTPAVPTLLQVLTDTIETDCSEGTDTCAVHLDWDKVTRNVTDTDDVAIDTYDVQRQQFDPVTAIETGPVETLTPLANALLQPGTKATYDDTVAYTDENGRQYKYKYRVRATTPCENSDYSDWIDYPPPCPFEGSVTIQSGAASGDGETPASAWVMTAGDSIEIQPPPEAAFSSVRLQVFIGGTPVSDESRVGLTGDGQVSQVFAWQDQTAGLTYTLVFSAFDTTGCLEQVTRYVQQEVPPGCTLRTAEEVTIVTKPAERQLRVNLINTDNEALLIEEITFTWVRPAQVTLTSVAFPSGGTVTVNSTASETFTVDVTPLPAGLTTADATIAGAATHSLFLNFDWPGNREITTAAITNICVKYRRASVVQDGSPILFFCRILPSAGAGNPFTSCN